MAWVFGAAAGWPLDCRHRAAEIIYPRLGLTEEFSASFEDQATRKPPCLAATFARNGLAAGSQ